MKKYFFTLLTLYSLFVPIQAKADRSYDPVAGREVELEKLLQEYKQAVQEGREDSKKIRKLLKKCLKKLEAQDKMSWKGNSDSKVALLFKLGTIVCLYQDYQEPSISYKIAALICIWLI